MPRLVLLSRETLTARTVLVGRSDQEPDRDLAYSVVAVGPSGGVHLRRHGRDGFTGSLERFEEYSEKVAQTIGSLLCGVPDLVRDRLEGELVSHLNATWEVCDAGAGSARRCPICEAEGDDADAIDRRRPPPN
jgi:hypothetical protein